MRKIAKGLLIVTVSCILSGCGQFSVDPRDTVNSNKEQWEDFGIEPYKDDRDRNPKMPQGETSASNRPTIESLKVVVSTNFPKETTEKENLCVAKVFYESPLSNDFLKALVDSSDYPTDSLDVKYIESQPFTDKIARCLGYSDYVEMQEQ